MRNLSSRHSFEALGVEDVWFEDMGEGIVIACQQPSEGGPMQRVVLRGEMAAILASLEGVAGGAPVEQENLALCASH